MEKKFTPGPWSIGEPKINHAGVECYPIDSERGATDGLATVYEAKDFPMSDYMANATLIAAAPELYEAISELIKEALIYIPTRDTVAFDAIHKSEAALKKATP